MSKVKKLVKASLSPLEAIGGILSPDAPAMPKVKPDDKGDKVSEARKRAQEAERLRKGQKSTILTGGKGVTEKLGSASRPGARASKLLGG